MILITIDIRIKTSVIQVFKAEQPLSYIRNNNFSIVAYRSPL